MKTQVVSFMETQRKDFGFSLRDEGWWVKVLFLSDLFDELNSLNSSPQGPSEKYYYSNIKTTIIRRKVDIVETQGLEESL